jgi:hypothetical protein
MNFHKGGKGMIMKRAGWVSALLLSGGALVFWAWSAEATANTVPAPEPAAWWGDRNPQTWTEQLIGEVITFQTLAEKGIVEGNFDPYLAHLLKVRNAYRAGNYQATYDGVNQFMTMLEVRVGAIDGPSAERLWDFCYRVTPDQYHARDRHIRAHGEEEWQKREQLLQMQEEKASLSF